MRAARLWGRAMQGSLGEKLGEGNTADIHAWAPGQIVKLFRSSDLRRFGQHEARATRVAFANGVPAPQVFDEVMPDGRFGIVLARLEGPTLAQQLLAGALTREEVGKILAGLYHAVHAIEPPPIVASLRSWMASAARSGGLPEHIATGVLTLIDRLPPGDGLCHGDLHPGNVIMTADGPKIIDWACALRAPGIFDIARAHITLTEIVAEDLDPVLPARINNSVQAEYARLTGVLPAELTAAMQPYLPILRAFVIYQQRPMTPAQKDALIQRIADALPPDT
jgi:tRNA A-37 threonylcarbamoyl transferase component Bud32